MDFCSRTSTFVLIIIVLMLLFIFPWTPCSGANILLTVQFGKGSHFMAACHIGRSLVERGHNVTALVAESNGRRADDPALSAFTFEIFKHSTSISEVERLEEWSVDAMLELSLLHFFEIIHTINRHNVNECESVMTDRSMLQRLQVTDVIMVDPAWPCGLLIKSYIENKTNRTVPIVALVPYTTPSVILRDAGSPFNPAYQADGQTGLAYPMSFPQRLFNTIFSTLMVITSEILFLKPYCELMDKLGLNAALRDDCNMMDTYDLYLLNSDVVTDLPLPMMPNVVAVGGVSTRPAMPLAKDYEDFIKGSGDDGVVIFTLGTIFSSITTKKPDLTNMFIDAFSRLPQRVIWQLHPEGQFELPPNVMASSWLPQNDLLGHTKTRLFIFHGGNNGYHEAVYHGVPVVVFPINADQMDIASRIQVKGIGKVIDKNHIDADIIYDTLLEVLQNDRYTTNVRRLSAIFKDRPMKPADRAAFWVEHVAKYGSTHIRSPVHALNTVQYYLLDVFAVLLLVALINMLILYKLIRWCLGFSFRCFHTRWKYANSPEKKLK